MFKLDDWRVVGEYVYDEHGGRHQAFYSPLHNTVALGALIKPHERIQVEESLKYSRAEAQVLWNRAGVTEVRQWQYGSEYGELSPQQDNLLSFLFFFPL